MDHNIRLTRYTPYGDDLTLTASLVECYRDVFAGAPWNEWLRCPQCGERWGVKDASLLAGSQRFSHCGWIPLVDFRSRHETIENIWHEITREASCWTAIDRDRVIGFCWGYPIVPQALEEKLGIAIDDAIKTAFGRRHCVAYQSETGVLSPYREQGIAKAMVHRRLDDFISEGLDVGIVRTRQYPEPSITFSWYTGKLGYRVLAEYPKEDGRVILGRTLADLPEVIAPTQREVTAYTPYVCAPHVRGCEH